MDRFLLGQARIPILFNLDFKGKMISYDPQDLCGPKVLFVSSSLGVALFQLEIS